MGSNTPDVEGDIFRPYDNVFSGNIVQAPAVAKIKEADGSVLTSKQAFFVLFCCFVFLPLFVRYLFFSTRQPHHTNIRHPLFPRSAPPPCAQTRHRRVSPSLPPPNLPVRPLACVCVRFFSSSIFVLCLGGHRGTHADNTFLDSVQLEFDDSHDTVFTDNTYEASSTTINVKNSACFDEEDVGFKAEC